MKDHESLHTADFSRLPHAVVFALLVLATFCATLNTSAQLIPNGGFELGTREPLVTNVGLSTVSFEFPEEALPSWEFSGSPLYYNRPILSGPGVTIYGAPPSPIEGDYSLGLQAGYVGFTNSVSVWQTIAIPADVRSVTYDVRVDSQVGVLFPLTPTIDGVAQLPVLLLSGVTADTYAIDVSAHSGSSAELRFTVNAHTIGGGADYRLDSVSFSALPIPEPSGLYLCLTAASLLTLRRR